jgi:6-phosphogluconolactonase/glucosamine-6-phosphate isomerase/deaminase
MKFIRVEGTQELTTALVDVLNRALATPQQVVWLVPGGSNISVATQVMKQISPKNGAHLTAVLTDERYGDPGHANSNYSQMVQAGFPMEHVTFHDVLHGASFEQTTQEMNQAMKRTLESADVIIGFFGMGADGHIAGILPHSPASVAEEQWVVGYDAEQFQRLTLTPFALSHVHTAYVGAFGAEKRTALETLESKMLPVSEQPAQLLGHIPESFIYNDQIGDTPHER